MRSEILLLLVCSACNTQIATAPGEPPASVRERLERSEARLFVSNTQSAGRITAERRIAHGEWETGLVDLHTASGEVAASADDRGAITIERLDITLAPIPISMAVFNRAAQLADVRVQLAEPARVTTTWVDDDEANVTAVLDLELSWSLVVDGSSTPLGAPKLPPVTLDVVVTGDGEFVHAELRAGAMGEVWSWADLIRLADLQLILGAETR